MENLQWPAGIGSKGEKDGDRTLLEDLRRVAQGEAPLLHAFQTIARCEESLAYDAADLREREQWAVTMIIDASTVLWNRQARPSLSFELDDPHDTGTRIELGVFTFLAGLLLPSAEEQAIIAATTPCWVHVRQNPARQNDGQTGPLTRTYTRISQAEALDILGFERILAQITAVTCEAGQALIAEAHLQRERHDRLQAVECMAGWGDLDPAHSLTDGTTPLRRGVVGVLLAFVLYVWRAITRSRRQE